MADTKITQLQPPQVGYPVVPATDVLPIVVIADPGMATSGSTRKVTVNQLLGAGGTATLASATISGDLTVDTSTLKVDSANNRVGIGTASPVVPLHILAPGTDTAAIRLAATGGRVFDIGSTAAGYGSANNLIIYDITGSAERWRLDSTGVHTWSNVGGTSGTAMTLNSTGLGVGVSPSSGKIAARAGTSATGNSIYLDNLDGTYNPWFQIQHSSSGIKIFNSSSFGGASNNLIFGNGTTSETMRIDSSGNVGIGVTPSAWGSGYKAIQGQIGGFALSNDNSSNNQFRLSSNAYFDTTDSRWEYYGSSTATAYEQAAGQHRFFNAVSGTANTAITFTQAMTLDASGQLLIGKTAANGANTGVELQTGAGGNTAGFFTAASQFAIALNRTTTDGYVADLRRQNTTVGNISVTTSGATFNSTSDYRLKESVAPLTGGLARVNALKPSIYKWKADGSAGEGFIAHELAEVVPAAVSGEKDAVNEDGSIKPQGVDMSRVVPILVAAIKELAAEVNALKNA